MPTNDFSKISVINPNDSTKETYEVLVDADHVIFDNGDKLSDKKVDKDVPIDHSAAAPIYGAASYEKYGHIKIQEGNGLTIEDGVLNLKLADGVEGGALDAETFNEIKDTIFKLAEEIEEIEFRKGAPRMHAHETTRYGAATEDLYGHVKVQTGTGLGIENGELSLSEASKESSGSLASEMYSKLDATYELLKNINEEIKDLPGMPDDAEVPAEMVFLIKEHASVKDTYGLASDTLYGHVKVKEENGLDIEDGVISLDTADETKNGAIDKIDYNKLLDAYYYFKKHEAEAGFRNSTPIYHASVKDTYGLGTTDLYGHVKVKQENGLVIEDGEVRMGAAGVQDDGAISSELYNILMSAADYYNRLIGSRTELTEEEIEEIATGAANIVKEAK